MRLLLLSPIVRRTDALNIGFQVLGHVKTVAVLAVGWLFFDTAVTMGMTAGAACALCGMVLYSTGSQPKKKKPVSDDASDAAV